MPKLLTFVGDICLAGRPSRDPSRLSQPLSQAILQAIGEDACLIGTVEAPISIRGTPKPYKACLRAEPQALGLLAGIEVGLLGNNHIDDYGPEAAIDTRAALVSIGCQPTGYGANLPGALLPARVDLCGVNVAILSFCCLTTRADGFATERIPGVAPLSMQLLRESIRLAQKEADLVVVCPHWGIQGSSLPTLDNILLARAAIECGASAVIGTHAHVIQASETYLGAPIFYGLGNYLFDDVDAPYVDHNGCDTGTSYRVKQTETNRTSLVVALRPVRDSSGWRLELAGRWLAHQADDMFITHEPLSGLTSSDRKLAQLTKTTLLDLNSRAEPSYICTIRDGVLVYNHRLPSLDKISFIRATCIRLSGIARAWVLRFRGR